MDVHALAWLIIAAQKHLLDKSFVSDVNALSHHLREFNALNSRLKTLPPPDAWRA
ncbi:hypothetical protein [Cystobacter fuscus]|uniref:hypothetical protein n=1 Tax=Cystobacter fuscus TaxID=43 RepID=UPI0037C13512